MAPDHWCWPNSLDIFALWDEGSERNLFHTSAPLCHEEADRIWVKTHLPAESLSLNNTEGVCVTVSTHPSKRHFVAHVLTSPNPPESQDLIRGTPSPAPPHTPIVCPLWRAPSLASARTHNRGPQKPLPVTLHESLGQRSLVASGLHDNSQNFPPNHPHSHKRKEAAFVYTILCIKRNSRGWAPTQTFTAEQSTVAAQWQETNGRKITHTSDKSL